MMLRFSLAWVVVLALAVSARPQEAPPDPKAGHPVEWEGWSFRWSIRKVEGLVITDVKFRGRSVLKYAGLCDVRSAYGYGVEFSDLSLKNGWGNLMQELVPGRDCTFPGAPARPSTPRARRKAGAW